jgi:hypothetical protein
VVVLHPDLQGETAGHNSNFAGQWSRRVATATEAATAGDAAAEGIRAAPTMAAATAEATLEAAAIVAAGAGTEATRARLTAAVEAGVIPEVAAMQAVAGEVPGAPRGDIVAEAEVAVAATEVAGIPEAAGIPEGANTCKREYLVSAPSATRMTQPCRAGPMRLRA